MAITTLTPTRLSIGRETNIVFASGATIVATSTLYDIFDAVTPAYKISAMAKNVTVTPPETAHDLQSFLGIDGNGFQNQILEEKPAGLATFTATLILDENEVLETFIDDIPITVTGSYTRYQIGNHLPTIDVLVDISGTSARVGIALIDAKVTKYGDVKLSGPDGHWEQDITGTCLAKNF